MTEYIAYMIQACHRICCLQHAPAFGFHHLFFPSVVSMWAATWYDLKWTFEQNVATDLSGRITIYLSRFCRPPIPVMNPCHEILRVIEKGPKCYGEGQDSKFECNWSICNAADSCENNETWVDVEGESCEVWNQNPAWCMDAIDPPSSYASQDGLDSSTQCCVCRL